MNKNIQHNTFIYFTSRTHSLIIVINIIIIQLHRIICLCYALKKKKNRKTLGNQSTDVLECTVYEQSMSYK